MSRPKIALPPLRLRCKIPPGACPIRSRPAILARRSFARSKTAPKLTGSRRLRVTCLIVRLWVMKRLSGFNLRKRTFPNRGLSFPAMTFRFLAVFLACGALAQAQEPGSTAPPAQSAEPSTTSISRDVKEIFDKSAKAVVKIRGTDQHGDLSGTGFFIDPAGTLYTAYSVGGDTENLTVEFEGKVHPARVMMSDVRS